MRTSLVTFLLLVPLAANAQGVGTTGSAAPKNPNLSPHVVEQEPFVQQGGQELSLFPAVFQANPRFTGHVGTSLSYVYHVNENLGLRLMGQYNWYTNDSALSQELINKVREEAQAASSLLLQWGATAGVELTPIYGKFAIYEGTFARFAVVFNAGAGLGSTRHELRPAVHCSGSDCQNLPATYGDTGLKMLGSIGAGFRVSLGDRFVLRLEVQDLMYTAKVDRVNGCNAADLSVLNGQVQAGAQTFSGAPVSAGCRASAFSGVDSRTGDSRALNVPPALALVQTPSSDVLNNIGLYAGIGYVF